MLHKQRTILTFFKGCKKKVTDHTCDQRPNILFSNSVIKIFANPSTIVVLNKISQQSKKGDQIRIFFLNLYLANNIHLPVLPQRGCQLWASTSAGLFSECHTQPLCLAKLTNGSILLREFRDLYEFLKSCPHSEIQCASSTAIRVIPIKNIYRNREN